MAILPWKKTRRPRQDHEEPVEFFAEMREQRRLDWITVGAISVLSVMVALLSTILLVEVWEKRQLREAVVLALIAGMIAVFRVIWKALLRR